GRLWCQVYDAQALLDQRQSSVLLLRVGIGLGVNVGNLLQLEGTLQGNGVVETSADVEQVLVSGDFPGQGANRALRRHCPLRLLRQPGQTRHQFSQFRLGPGAADPGQIEPQKVNG